MVCDFSPNAFFVFGFPIHWYSLAYVFGIVFALWLAVRLGKTAMQWREAGDMEAASLKPPSKIDLEEFLNYAVIGMVLGGRLGHVFFYDSAYYFEHPMEILRVWKGGMSFFGGFLGSISAAAIFCRRKNINFWNFADIWAVGAPVGLFFGRIANFINGELLGKETTVAWGVIFKDGVVRHPSQLYEAFLEGVLLFATMLYCFYGKKLYVRKGALSGAFCVGYGMARFIGEFFREPDSSFSYELLMTSGLNLNQYMSVGIFAVGVFLLYCRVRKRANSN